MSDAQPVPREDATPEGAPEQDAPRAEMPKSQRQFRGRYWQTPEGMPFKPRPIEATNSPTTTVSSEAPPGTAPAGILLQGAAAAVVRPSAGGTPSPARPAPTPPPLAITRTERDAMFQRYAELRQRLDASPHDAALLVETARLAEELDLVLEGMELWHECLRLDPANAEATRRLAALDRRAGATGETGRRQTTSYKPKELAPEAAPFWMDLGSVLAFPFRGKGPGVLVAGALCFAVFEIMATFNIFVGGFMVLAIWGYLAAWQFDVISRSAAGKDDPAEFPEFATIVDSCVLPLVSFAGCVLFSYAPVLLPVFLVWKGWLPAGVGLVVALVMMVPSAFVFPMSLAVRSLFESTSEAMNPRRVYGAIARVLPDYMLAFVALVVLWATWAVVRLGLILVLGLMFGLPTPAAVFHFDLVGIVGWLLYTVCVWPLLLYVWAVQGHILGRVYCQSYKRLAWFVAPGVEAARARRMSASIVFAGIAGAVVLVGAALLTWKMGPGGKSAAVVNGSASCPVAPGGSLTYFWENTDGPAGVSTYTFEPAGEGKLHVKAAYLHADQFGVSRMADSVGLVDADSGVVERYDGERSAIPQTEKRNLHSRFFGPPRSRDSGTYINDWSVRGALRWQSRWNVVKVIEPESSAELYYDKATGVLVGRKFGGLGFTVTEWLCDAKGVAGIADCPPPNRTFPPPGQEEEVPFSLPAMPVPPVDSGG